MASIGVRVLALVAALGSPGLIRAQEAPVVDAALVLAIDVSGSMDSEELEVQRQGYIAALRHPDLIRIVQAGWQGRVAISLFEWAGDVRTSALVPWRVIDSPEAILAFAGAVEALPVYSSYGTSISRAIDFAVDLIAIAPVRSEAWIVDISGDGPNNIGPAVVASRDRAVAQGITINALPVVLRPSRGASDLTGYFEACVIGGWGAFALPVRSPEEFAPAIRRKLILELSGDAPERLHRVSDHEAYDCLIGERQRRERISR